MTKDTKSLHGQTAACSPLWYFIPHSLSTHPLPYWRRYQEPCRVPTSTAPTFHLRQQHMIPLPLAHPGTPPVHIWVTVIHFTVYLLKVHVVKALGKHKHKRLLA